MATSSDPGRVIQLGDPDQQVVGAIQQRGQHEAVRSFVIVARLLVGILAGAGLLATPCAEAQRPGLLGVIDRCYGPGPSSACIRCDKDFDTCGERGKPDSECKAVTVLWHERGDFVAIRDLKMCVAPRDSELAHGLAIWRLEATGLEDPKRPPGIWDFAWEAAAKALGDERKIALLVNPCLGKGQKTKGPEGCLGRTQNQLHIHLLRFCEGKKDEAMRDSAVLSALDRTWDEADRLIRDRLIRDGLQANPYGAHSIFVDRDSSGQFRVAVHEGNVEEKFTYSRHDQGTRGGCASMKSKDGYTAGIGVGRRRGATAVSSRIVRSAPQSRSRATSSL